MSCTAPVVQRVIERAIEGGQIEAVAIMSDDSEESLVAFYPDERYISAAALIGLTAFNASRVVGNQFSNWLSQH